MLTTKNIYLRLTVCKTMFSLFFDITLEVRWFSVSHNCLYHLLPQPIHIFIYILRFYLKVWVTLFLLFLKREHLLLLFKKCSKSGFLSREKIVFLNNFSSLLFFFQNSSQNNPINVLKFARNFTGTVLKENIRKRAKATTNVGIHFISMFTTLI